MAVVTIAGLWIGSAGSAVSTEWGSPLSADGMAVYQSAVEAFKAGRRDEALPLFERVADRSSGYLRICATNMAGQIHRLAGRDAEALASFSSVATHADRELQLETGPSADRRHLEMLRWLAICYQAEIHECRRSWVEAIRCYERAIEKPGDCPHFAGTEGGALRRVGLVRQNPAAKWGLSPSASTSHAPSEPNLAANDGAGKPCPHDATLYPALAERLGGLYWRTGQWDKSRKTFEDLLARWPAYERAPAIEVALISLANASEDLRRRKLACLALPLAVARSGPTDAISSGPDALPSLPSLPLVLDPVLQRLDEVLVRVGADSPWRPILLMRKGWLLFEMDRVADAAPVFAEAERLAAVGRSPRMDAVRDYAAISGAFCLWRKQQFIESLEAAQKVIGSRPQGCLQVLAGSLVENLSKRQEATEAGAKCGVTLLK